MPAPPTSTLQWLGTGSEIFPAMLEAIRLARISIRLETYIYSGGSAGRQFLAALRGLATRRARAGAGGRFWIVGTTESFFAPLLATGAEVHFFNPLHLWRFGVRDHRKLLVCDDAVAFVGGFNIADEYDGDGVTRGWCDLGARIENPTLAVALGKSFDELFALADFHRKPLMRLRAFKRKRKSQPRLAGELLFSHPGRGASPFQIALHRDLSQARNVRIISAYFLPTRRVRRQLMHAARNGGRVQLILAGRSDVLISQLAARSLYHRLLKAGVEIYEYQPQILHGETGHHRWHHLPRLQQPRYPQPQFELRTDAAV